MMQSMGGMGGMMAACLGMMPLAVAAWVAVALAAVSVARRLWHRPQLSVPAGIAGDAALATLRERYARGEIDRAEYEARQQALSDRPPHWP